MSKITLRRPLVLRSLAALSLGASWALACGAPPPSEDGGTSANGVGDGDTDIQIGDGDGDQTTDTIDPIMGEMPTAKCDDGIRDEDEACDDGNQSSGDGCGSNCRYIEEGFICPDQGQPCRPYAKCGDNAVIFPEQCDDGNATTSGCSTTCKIEIGYNCTGSPSSCVPTVCGDKLIEGAETCDDGNNLALDGCSDICQAEPKCTEDGCTGTCGDGLVLNEEECDDGNALDGDGCSAACLEEPGYMCGQAECDAAVSDCSLSLPIVYRDFDQDHADFEKDTCSSRNVDLDLVEDKLNANGKPVAKEGNKCFSAGTFAEWYGDAEGSYATIPRRIVLHPNGSGGFVNRYGDMGEQYASAGQAQFCGSSATYADCQAASDAGMCNGIVFDPALYGCWAPTDANKPTSCAGGDALCAAPIQLVDGNPLFFPLDDLDTDEPRFPAKIPAQIYGGVGFPWEAGGTAGGDAPANSPLHNFAFTSEVTYWFEYDAAADAKLTFIGDDDVWVFVNRKLAVDLGGIHVPIAGYVAMTGGEVQTQSWEPPEAQGGADIPIQALTTDTAASFGLEDGKVYEIKVFQAERQQEGSSFQLTLAGFNTARSDCIADCGDGIIAGGEQCDDGDELNVGGHDRCTKECTLGSFCGDGVVQAEAGEECDDNDPTETSGTCNGCQFIILR